MPYLIKRYVDSRVETTEIADANLTIGRGTSARLRLDDDAVDLEHAEITENDSRFVISDRHSLTGTYVNGKKIDSFVLSTGDRITVGPFSLKAALPTLSEPFCLEFIPFEQEKRSAAAGFVPDKVDYAGLYALNRKLFNKTMLSVFLLFSCVISVAVLLFTGKTTAFRPGNLSEAHALFSNQCSSCHTPWQGPSAQACEKCHAGAVHHESQVHTPSCVSCHVEHRNVHKLAAVDNASCVTCHSDLRTQPGTSTLYVKRVTDFVNDHPQFSVSMVNGSAEKRIRVDDRQAMRAFQGKISLNHERHLEKAMEGPNNSPVQLQCHDCHQPTQDGKRMIPVTFAAHCAECHNGDLVFDQQFPDRRVPHGSVEKVRAYLVSLYSGSPVETSPDVETGRRLLGTPAAARLNPALEDRVRTTETQVFKFKCKKCHELNFEAKPLPKVEDPFTPVVWFRHAEFRHRAHRFLQCVACHDGANKSNMTEDVLVPGIEKCRNCHSASQGRGGLQQGSAPTNCSSCHVYHNKKNEMNWNGRLLVQRFTSESKSGPAGRPD